jgi:hypothetical protein
MAALIASPQEITRFSERKIRRGWRRGDLYGWVQGQLPSRIPWQNAIIVRRSPNWSPYFKRKSRPEEFYQNLLLTTLGVVEAPPAVEGIRLRFPVRMDGIGYGGIFPGNRV